MTKLAIALFLAPALLATAAQAQQTTVTRDHLGREVVTTQRSRGTVVVRDRFGREIVSIRKGSTR